jgi:hypothetical protein
MNRAAVLEHLAHTERHIRDGERHLLRQREIVAELECHGHGHSTAARLARDLLELFEKAQSAHLDERARLMLALQASK